MNIEIRWHMFLLNGIWLYFILTLPLWTILFVLSFDSEYHEGFVSWALHVSELKKWNYFVTSVSHMRFHFFRFGIKFFFFAWVSSLLFFFVVGQFHYKWTYFFWYIFFSYSSYTIFIFYLFYYSSFNKAQWNSWTMKYF